MKKNIKNKKPATRHKATPPKKVRVKRKLPKKSRPIHKKIVLHPISVLFMLCLGVILILSTFYASAASYTVMATVPDPPGPSQPATLATPTNGQHFSTSTVKVTGTCPADPYTNVYVALFTNNVWTGYSNCVDNTYEISTLLYPGENSLQVRVFDFYNTPGPLLPAINVYYDAPYVQPISPPIVPPQAIQVLQEDNNIPFVSASVIPNVTTEPTITGTAPPFSHVVVTIHSAVVYCYTVANAQGFWSCKVNQPLPVGLHHISVQATTPLGKVITFQTFQFVATKEASTPVAAVGRFSITTNFRPTQYLIDKSVSYEINAAGGVGPYAFNIDWGDGTNSTVTRLASGPFEITHTYSKTDALVAYETIKIEGIDSQGQASSLQFFAPIKNPAYKNFVTYITKSTGLWSVFASIKNWLWIIWPSYAIIMLMIFSFWLGEQQELIKLLSHSHKRTMAKK